MTDDTGYLLDTAQPVAGERFDALSELFDAWTFRHLAGGALDLATWPLITAWGRTPRGSGSGSERHEIRESPA